MSTFDRRLKRVVRGALIAAINDHGPITADNLDSAIKRVVSQIDSAAEVRGDHAECKAALDHAFKRIERLRYGNRRLTELVNRLRAKELVAAPTGRDET
jgi:hypothetical protein